MTTSSDNIGQSLGGRIDDTSWVRQSFLTTSAKLDELTQRNRTFTTASLKYSDTRLGGSIEINPPPQFCRNADIKVPSVVGPGSNPLSLKPVISTSGLPQGLGRYWSEALDDNKHIVSLRFGQPQYNSLTTFFTHFYNHEAGTLARSGRSTGLLYTLGKAVGFLLPLLNLPLLLLTVGGAIWNAVSGKPNSRYYYLKPAMPLYWNAVQSIVNLIAVNKGITPRVMSDLPSSTLLSGQYNFSSKEMAKLASMMPDVAMTDSEGTETDALVGINVYAMATRHQRMARQVNKALQQALANATSENDLLSAFGITKNSPFSGIRLDLNPGAGNPSFQKYLTAYLSSSMGKPLAGGSNANLSPSAIGADGSSSASAASEPKPSIDIEALPTGLNPDGTANSTDTAGWTDFLQAELEDGSQFVSFRVEESGPINESFSNSVGESDIASKMNSMSSDARSTKFSLAGGNLGDGAIAKTVQAFVQGASDVVAGLADGVGLSGLATFGGAAFVDIPKYWQNSIASLPRMNYSFTLVSPYGNKLSQLFNLHVPLAMILAGALPLSTGKQSYTSPFICEVYDRGRAQTRLGMIDSLSINRGVGNLGFDNNGNAMSIEVSFSIVNLTSIMHMPIAQGFSLANPLGSFIDQDSAFSDYMSVLGGLTLDEQSGLYFADSFRRNLTMARQQMRTWFSRAHTAQWFSQLSPIQFASMFYAGVANR